MSTEELSNEVFEKNLEDYLSHVEDALSFITPEILDRMEGLSDEIEYKIKETK